jgi:hypothetical protein
MYEHVEYIGYMWAFAGHVPSGMPFIFAYTGPSAAALQIVSALGCLLSVFAAPIVYSIDYVLHFVSWAHMKALVFAVPLLLHSLRRYDIPISALSYIGGRLWSFGDACTYASNKRHWLL